LRRLANRKSPSPSPSKRARTNSALHDEARTILRPTTSLADEDDDEDEETLQLQLQEIQARLKLKKLQKAKIKDIPAVQNVQVQRETALLVRAGPAATARIVDDLPPTHQHRMPKIAYQEIVDVPASPTRKVQNQEVTTSPKRVLLGIDKGLRGSDVSLRRAPSLANGFRDPSQEVRRAGPYLHRSNSQAGSHVSNSSRPLSGLDGTRSRSQTFNERLADARNIDVIQKERAERIERLRTKAFDIDAKEIEGYKDAAASVPEVQTPVPEFSRDQIVSAYSQPSSDLRRSKSASAISSRPGNTSGSTKSQTSTQDSGEHPATGEPAPTSLYESYSSLFLSKRIIPHNVLSRTLTGKKTYTVPEVLREVKAPHWKLPDVEADIVVLGVIASKSEPKAHKTKVSDQERKFMVMTLADLKHDINVFLFDTGFEKYWKLDAGTVVAILNPTIMAPKVADTGNFSLVLNSSDDTVLEIGTARDLGFCKAVKKDGKTCDAWIDKRHTEICEFHVNEALRKTKAGRMEVNSIDFGRKRGGPSGSGERRVYSRGAMVPQQKRKDPNNYYDREAGKVFIAPAPRGRSDMSYIGGPGKSTTQLLDDVDLGGDMMQRGSTKEERLRRHLAEKEKEKDIARKLASVGGGLGADYMRIRDQAASKSATTNDNPSEPPPESANLGLLNGMPKAIHLSPVKRKRASDASNVSTLAGTAARGWGSQLTNDLTRMKNGERLQPIKKKTRFITEKGIREAGRESFGGDGAGPAPPAENDDDDDDDDLDIIG
jgi:minichromosome maintenance protein 10